MYDHEQYTATTLDLIDGSARRVIDIYMEKLRVPVINNPVPFGTHAFYQAAVVHSRLVQETGDLRHTQSINLLKDALWHMNKRWRIAGEDNNASKCVRPL